MYNLESPIFAMGTALRFLDSAHRERLRAFIITISALKDGFSHFRVNFAAADHNPSDLNQFMDILYKIVTYVLSSLTFLVFFKLTIATSTLQLASFWNKLSKISLHT